MEQNQQVSLEQLAQRLKHLELEVARLRNLQKAKNEEDIDWDWEGVEVFADEKLLAETWLSPEDEEAWKDL